MSKRLEQRQTQIDQQNVCSLVPSLAGFKPQLNKHIRPKMIWSLQSTYGKRGGQTMKNTLRLQTLI
jgi:hypothetical protein